MPDGDEATPDSDENDGRDSENDRASENDGGDAGPKQRLEETAEEISRAGEAATDASDELKKDVRAKVDDARETS